MNNTIPLQELFNNRILRIPNYQRGYAWENLQIGEVQYSRYALSQNPGTIPVQYEVGQGIGATFLFPL
ncbi:MAG: hypothetical protein OXH50_10490 [Gemmatimonadetes bacterium]|nr:hypothetical protein [Gemmatimonadota bacterium]